MNDNLRSDQGGRKRLIILGSTGSIGQSTLDVVRNCPKRFEIDVLVANRNIEQLARDAVEFNANLAVTADETLYGSLKATLDGSGIEVAAGQDAVVAAAARPAGMVMAAIVGADGLRPTLSAIEAGSAIGLANKECLVSAGDLFMDMAAKNKVDVIPVDSEHSAIFQCLETENFDQIDRIVLTASGGPFRTFNREQMRDVTVEQALAHPNWSMGAKITIDSATMMNKGLELIEAYFLFPVGLDRLDIVVHPQSIIHSYVGYRDGSVLAQLGQPDMRTPIAHALVWPERVETPVERLDLAAIATLTFEAADRQRFPALALAEQALKRGGTAKTILNAANEIAVAEFLSKKIGYVAITDVIGMALERAERQQMIGPLATLDDVWEADSWARSITRELACGLQP